ncbi:MAG: hypothetical protein EBT67_10660 [Betaproteobacteria bacterium]|nr:hypothetical protein [Betaproteobacteria bacterium]
MSAYEAIIMYKDPADKKSSAEVLKFFDWSFKNGKKMAEELDYVSLPDVLVSDHTPVEGDAKYLPFAQAQPGATASEMLLSATLKWATQSGVNWMRALQTVTSAPAALLGTAGEGLGHLQEGGPADICIYDPAAQWEVTPEALVSQSKHTPFWSVARWLIRPDSTQRIRPNVLRPIPRISAF